MKRCPECGREYDTSMMFCLDDGAELLYGPSSADEQPTAVLDGPPRESPTQIYPSGEESPPIPQPALITSRRKSIIAGAIGILIVAAVGLGGYWFYGNRTNRIDSIAVMPFVNESGNSELEYLSDGITETLIGTLSQLPNLRVKARSSVFRYKGKEADPKTVSKELGVQAVLNGRVLQRGQEIVLYLELVDPVSEDVLWKSDYNRPMANLVALQRDIARDVAERLRIRLSGTAEQKLARNYTENTEAYQLYLKGRFHWNRRTKIDIHKAIDYYRQAVTVDPTYALAYAGLADAHVVLQGYDADVLPREMAIKAKDYSSKALSLDDSLSDAHASLALVLQNFDHDFVGAEREFKRAIELDSNNAANHVWFALLLAGFGRFEEGDAHCRRAVEIEPASPNINRNYGQFLQIARRFDESVEQLRRTIDLDPNFVLSYQTLAQAYLSQGRYADGLEQYAKAREILGDREQAEFLRNTFAADGWPGVVRAISETPERAGFRPKYIRATLLLTVGENERALAKLEESYEERETFLTFINVDARLDPLRSDPRFLRLQEKIGVPK